MRVHVEELTAYISRAEYGYVCIVNKKRLVVIKIAEDSVTVVINYGNAVARAMLLKVVRQSLNYFFCLNTQIVHRCHCLL